MEAFSFLVCIIALILGVLQIILFFKIWGMTNNVQRLTDKICAEKPTVLSSMAEHISTEDPVPAEQKAYDKGLDDVKKGDKIIRISDGAEMTVDEVGKGRFFCKTGSLSGYKWFSIYEVKTVSEE